MHLLATSATTVPDVSIGHALVQMVIALGVIVGGIWGLSRILQRVRSGPRASRAPRRDAAGGLTVLSRQPLGKDLSLAAVRWGEREVLVGIAGSTITFLGDGSPPAAESETPAANGRRQPESTDARALASRTSAPSSVSTPRPSSADRASSSLLDALREATLRR